MIDDADDGYFPETVADAYDENVSDEFDARIVQRTVDFLSAHAGRGRVLELGIGTGRIALPFAARGVTVHGIDMSRAMVAKMRAKPGGADIGVTFGDFATTKAEVEGGYSLAYLVFNTIMNLTTQDEQVACFANVAAHLRPGGRFVIEVMMPQLRLLPPGQTAVTWQVGPTGAAADVYDVATQFTSSNYYSVVNGRGTVRSIPFRYVWPAELDLMARLAGMSLVERWEDWGREPFHHESTKHISVWEKA